MKFNLKNTLFLIFLLCSLVFLCSFVNAQTITIEGRLIDRESKSPISNIEFEIRGQDGQIINAITTDDGFFIFDYNLSQDSCIYIESKNNDSFRFRYHEDFFSFCDWWGEVDYILFGNNIPEYNDMCNILNWNSETVKFKNITGNRINIGDINIYPSRKNDKMIKFKGYLLDQVTFEPIVNATIIETKENIPLGITDEQGSFEFEFSVSKEGGPYIFQVDNVADYYNVYDYDSFIFNFEYDYQTCEFGKMQINKNSFDGQGEELFFDKTDSEIDLGNLYLYPMFDMLIESDVSIMISHDNNYIVNNLDSDIFENGYMKRAYIKKFLPVNYQSKLFIVMFGIFQKAFELKTPIGNPKEEFIYIVYDNNHLNWELLPISERPRISDITYNNAQVINEKEKKSEEFSQMINKAGQEYFNKYGFVHTDMPPRSIASINILIKEGLLSEDFYTKYCYGCYEFNNQTYFEHNCFDFGFRKEDQYCSENGTFTNMILPGELCNNNYECESNSCSEEGFCNKNSFTQRLINFFNNLF